MAYPLALPFSQTFQDQWRTMIETFQRVAKTLLEVTLYHAVLILTLTYISMNPKSVWKKSYCPNSWLNADNCAVFQGLEDGKNGLYFIFPWAWGCWPCWSSHVYHLCEVQYQLCNTKLLWRSWSELYSLSLTQMCPCAVHSLFTVCCHVSLQNCRWL